MSGRVGVLVFPGTNSEDETLRACRAVGLDATLVHWNAALDDVRAFAAYVLPGGFAYEDRVRAGAIAAHDRLMIAVREGAALGKPVLGICNGAQILLESGLAPELDGVASAQAGFTRNAPQGRYRSTHVHVKLVIDPARCAITASMPEGAVLPAWASHGEGRLAAHPEVLERLQAQERVAFVYCDAAGTPGAVPNGSALGAAALVNASGNVLAIMPHPERAAWTFMRRGEQRERARGNTAAMLATSGGIALFEGSRARLWCAVSGERCIEVVLTIPDNEARTALATLQRLGVAAAALERADLYRCAVDDAGAERLVETFSGLEPVFNPNKHALRVRDGDRPLAGEVWVEMLEDPGGVASAPANATVRIAGRVLPGVSRVERAVAWRLFDATGAPAEPEVVRRATQLLCNPAFQKATTA